MINILRPLMEKVDNKQEQMSSIDGDKNPEKMKMKWRQTKAL